MLNCQVLVIELWKCLRNFLRYNEQKRKFSIKDFFSKCDQFCKLLRIWSHLLKKPMMENFIFCAMIKQMLYLNIIINE